MLASAAAADADVAAAAVAAAAPAAPPPPPADVPRFEIGSERPSIGSVGSSEDVLLPVAAAGVAAHADPAATVPLPS